GSLVAQADFPSPKGSPYFGLSVDTQDNIIVTADGSTAFTLNGLAFTPKNALGTDLFIMKLDSMLNGLWLLDPGGTAGLSGGPYGLATDGAANIVTCGLYTGTIDFGQGPLPGMYGAYIARLPP